MHVRSLFAFRCSNPSKFDSLPDLERKVRWINGGTVQETIGRPVASNETKTTVINPLRYTALLKFVHNLFPFF
jgi:hypothetical protein